MNLLTALAPVACKNSYIVLKRTKRVHLLLHAHNFNVLITRLFVCEKLANKGINVRAYMWLALILH